jgi:hypothetical protein
MSDGRRMRARPHWWLSVAEAMVLLPVVRLMLWTQGYRGTMRWLSTHTPQGRRDIEGGVEVPDAVAEIASAVTAVARLVPFRSRCLARSITIWWLCRRQGHEVDVLIGVAQPEGDHLPAHAWAEYRRTPLNDTADVRDRYVVIAP